VTGQIFLFAYSGLIAHMGSKFGFNFGMMCKAAFGRYAYAMPTLLIAALVTGWYAFQAWLAADLMIGLYGGHSFNAGTGSGILPGILGTTGFWAGVFAIVFGMMALYGMRVMAYMSYFAVGSVTILTGWMLYTIMTVIANDTGGNPWSSHIVGEPWTFALGFTASIGTFIVSSTMTGDFVRWTKTAKQAWAVTLVAFPVCNLMMLMVGGIFTAVAGKLDFYFGLSGILFGIPIMMIQWFSNGSVCDGCMYNAAQGYKNVLNNILKGRRGGNISWRKVSMIVILVGTAVGAANLLTSIVPWLLLLGTVVTLVGGVLIGHFWIVARKNNVDELLAASEKKVNTPAIIGFLAGLVIAVVIVVAYKDLPAVIGGLIGGVVVYPIVARITGYTKGGRLTPKGLGTGIDYDSARTNGQPHTPSPPSGSVGTNTRDAHIQSRIDKIVEFFAPRWSTPSYKRGHSI
jgi:cytosine permease